MCLGGGTPREACSLTPSPLSRAFREVTKWTSPFPAHTDEISFGPRITSDSEAQQEGTEEVLRTKPHICAEEGIEAQRGEATCPESHSP